MRPQVEAVKRRGIQNDRLTGPGSYFDGTIYRVHGDFALQDHDQQIMLRIIRVQASPGGSAISISLYSVKRRR
jgi:hypothetical protein